MVALAMPVLFLLAKDAGAAGATRAVPARSAAIERVPIPAGRFFMGAAPEDVKEARARCNDEQRRHGAFSFQLSTRCGLSFDDEGPEVEVVLPTFAVDRTEVTVGAYAACVRAGPCRGSAALELSPADARLPVERVTFHEAEAYCRARGGRLPTEAEWEKAARGGSRRAYPWGAGYVPGRANAGRPVPGESGPDPGETEEQAYDDADGFAGRAPVGSFPAGASPYGVLDLAGNVWEWTSGFYARRPPQADAWFDPRGPLHAELRAVRGGGYRSPPTDLRATRRAGLRPDARVAGIGFRCAYDEGR